MADTETPSGLKRAIAITPERWLRIKAVTAFAVISGTVTCTAYVVRMWDKVNQTAEGVTEISKRLEPLQRQNDIMWDAYSRQPRTASLP